MARLVERRRTTLTGDSAATPSPVNANPTQPVAAVPRQTPIRRTSALPGLRPTALPPAPAPVLPDPAPAVTVTKPGPVRGIGPAAKWFEVKYPKILGMSTPMLRSYGAFNPFAPLQTPGVKGLKSFLPPKVPKGGSAWKMRGGRMFAATSILASLLGGQLPDDIEYQTQVYRDLGYPDDAAKAAAEAYNGASKVGQGVATVADLAAVDLQVALAGAAIGTVVPVVGTAVGFAAGTTLAGISNIVLIGEGLLTAAASFAGAEIGMSGKWIDLPTADDYFPGISGIVGQENYYGTAASSAGAFAADNAIAQKYPNRFNGADYVYRELTRLDSNYYGMSSDVDPRAKEMYDLISKGYFVKQTPNGLGIDNASYHEYLSKTMMYKNQEDKNKFLPSGTTPFLKGGTMTEDQWYSLFGNAN